MAKLNYKHLSYFWMVGKTGSIVRASEQLFVTPQSISGQLAELEQSLNVKLFRKAGRGLELSDMGRKIFSYADEIFTLGNELVKLTQSEDVIKCQPFHIGIADSVAKSIAYRVIEPILKLDNSIRLTCKEGKLPNLLSQMSINRLDLVIADRPMPTNLNVRAHNHFLGESKLAIFGKRSLIEENAGEAFPKILNNAKFLIPGEDFAIQKKLLQWFESKKIYPHFVAEFDDSALLKSFGQSGAGFFAAPNAIAEYICKQYEVEVVGVIDTLQEQLYAITTERRLTHPAIISLIKSTNEIYSKEIGA
jgi:LysR family transcriptional activator of nhaA